MNISVKASSPEELTELLGKMTPEQLEQLKEQLAKMETAEAVDGESEDGVNAEAEAATKETAETAPERKMKNEKSGSRLKEITAVLRKHERPGGSHQRNCG